MTTNNLSVILRKWRLINELTVRELAHDIGFSLATLRRIEEGREMTASTLMKIFNWLCKEQVEKKNG